MIEKMKELKEENFSIPISFIEFTNFRHSSSVIRDFKFDTELTPEFSTMISVAATSNGSAVGENNTALSKLNLGVKDKYKIAVDGGGAELSSNKPDPVDAALENFTTAAGEYFRFASRFNVYLEHLYKAVLYIVNNLIRSSTDLQFIKPNCAFKWSSRGILLFNK